MTMKALTLSRPVAAATLLSFGCLGAARADGVRHKLSPQAAAGNCIDEGGRETTRSKGQIYRLTLESI
jgi:hypothetical protein